MFDLMSATRGAVFRALGQAITDTPVYEDVPPDTKPPFLKIGEIDTENASTKSEQAETLTIEVYAVYRGEDRGVLLAMMHQARNALDLRTITATGAAFAPMRFLKGSSSDAWEGDGVTFAGILTFEVLAEPA